MIEVFLHGPEESREENLEKVQGLDGLNVVQIAAGAEHSALVTGNILFNLIFTPFVFVVCHAC